MIEEGDSCVYEVFIGCCEGVVDFVDELCNGICIIGEDLFG